MTSLRFFSPPENPDIDRPAQHVLLDAELARHRAHPLEEFRHQQLRLAAILALRIERRLQEVEGGDAGNLQRILEGEKDALGGALVRLQGEHVLAFEQHLALGDRVVGLAGEHMGERRFARAVGAHDGVHLALLDRQIETVEDLLAVDLDVQVLDFQAEALRFPLRSSFMVGRWPVGMAASFIAGALRLIPRCPRG